MLSVLILAVGFGACATGTKSRPVAEFPTAQTLTAIESKPVALPRVLEGPVPEAGWTVEVPASPSSHEPWAPSSGWDRAVADAIAASGKRPRLSQAMSCVAREMGRYYLETRLPPPAALRNFLVTACGALAPDVGVLTLGGDVPVEVPEDAILARWKRQLGPELIEKLPAGATDAGFAFQRRKGAVLAVLVFVQLRAEIEPMVPVPNADGQITIAGRLKEEAQFVAGYVNTGPYGVSSCYVDPTVARPSFSVTCTVAPDDATARIDLVFAQPRRVLAIPFLQVLVRKAELTRLSYRDAALAAGPPIANATEFPAAALTALNQVRAQAGLSAVRLAATQSGAATRVAGHFFSAMTGEGSSEQADTIALGLLAGWQVTGGLIRDATFVATLVPSIRDVGRWLVTTLEFPLGRAALLAEDIEEVAFGPVSLAEPEALGSVVVGYRFHHGSDHAGDVRRLLTRAVLARRQRSLAAPKRLGLEAVMKEELARVHAGEAQPSDALQTVLEAGVVRFGADMRGYVVETTSLDALEIPAEVLSQPTLHLEIGVTHHRPPGAAWAQLVILVIFVDYGHHRPV